MLRRMLATIVAAAALGAGVSAAHADHVAPNLGIEVTAVDPATRTVEGVVHCTTPERAGRTETFEVAPDIPFDQFQPRAIWGIAVGLDGMILSTGPMPCNVRPGGPAGPGPGGPGFGPGPGGEDADFARGFIRRVWKFQVSVDAVDNGTASVTIEKVLNLPKRFRDQDDELVDEDAIVLIARNVRILRDGKRVGTGDLEDADTAVVHGKLLPPSKWQKDEDGEPVATVRAKKLHLR